VQLAELQSGYNDLKTEGAEIIAIGIDNQLNTQRLAQQTGLRFPTAYDESATVAAGYGVRDQLAGDFTTAIFILDRDLKLIANAVGTTADQMIPVEVILNIVQEANGTAPPGGTST
jgi:peroxiredoxin